MAPKHHPTPLSGGDRKALKKELMKSRAMTGILAQQSAQLRGQGEDLIQRADDLSCQSWNERMWSAGEPIDPSPTIDQAINGGYSWLQIQCSRCKNHREVDLCIVPHEVTTFVHDLSTRLRCEKCKKVGKRPAALLLQLAPGPRYASAE
jgi:phage FluMu protein Com